MRPAQEIHENDYSLDLSIPTMLSRKHRGRSTSALTLIGLLPFFLAGVVETFLPITPIVPKISSTTTTAPTTARQAVRDPADDAGRGPPFGLLSKFFAPKRDGDGVADAATPPPPPHAAAAAAGANRDDLLATHGDWRAYFDANDSCLVYYFNTQTGRSQWEAPKGFPATISLQPSQLEKMARKRQQVSESADSGDKQDNNDWNIWGGLWNMASGALTSKKGASDPQKNSEDDNKNEDDKPWWNIFASSNREDERSEQQQKQQPSFWDIIFAAKKEETEKDKQPPFWASLFQPSAQDVKELKAEIDSQLHYEVNNKRKPKDDDVASKLHYEVRRDFYIPEQDEAKQSSGFLDHFGRFQPSSDDDDDPSPTRPLQDNKAPGMMSLEEKRLLASDKRQANLRRNYDAVIVDRSPTVSLTAIKKGGKHKDWYQYLDDP